jgi:hypothetical protein
MTPNEKAEELVLKFEAYTDSADERGFAKECALIAVNELLENTAFKFYNLETSELIKIKYNDFWEDVKQKINKL